MMRLLVATLLLAMAAVSARADDPCNPPREILVKRVLPPARNPYPPTDAGDQKRVQLALEAIRRRRRSAGRARPALLGHGPDPEHHEVELLSLTGPAALAQAPVVLRRARPRRPSA
jgi:hypothetical protein